jgi:hypothetical protein
MADPCQTRSPLVQGPDDAPRDAAGNRWLVIEDARELKPFLMSIVSDSDLWMYVSSAHALTCGRGQAERCLFPYETDDRLHRAGGLVGPWTALRVTADDGAPVLWRPFGRNRNGRTTWRLYKTELGDRVLFEACCPSLGLVFRYRWASCEAYGFVRTAELTSTADGPLEVEVLDGLLGIMPSGVVMTTQQRASALVNAYRRSERLRDTPRLAVYALSAGIVDRAEPAEALRANAVWSVGLEGAEVLLDEASTEQFLRGEALVPTDEHRGRPGAYLMSGRVSLSAGETSTWHLVADVDRSQAEVVKLIPMVGRDDAAEVLEAAIDRDTRSLHDKLAAADGLQVTGDAVGDAHHLANVQPPARRPEPAVEQVRDRPSRRPVTALDARALDYEGNWRDIFQNWEALAWSFPEFVPERGREVRQRHDGRRLQPLPHHARRHRLGGARARRPLVATSATGATTRSSTCSSCSRRPERFHPGAVSTSCSTRAVFTYADVPYRIAPTPIAAPTPTTPSTSTTAAHDADRGGWRRGRRRPAAADAADGDLLPRQPGREAAGAAAGEAGQPRARRRHLDEHPAPGVERRQQRARRLRRVDGDAGLPAALPGPSPPRR